MEGADAGFVRGLPAAAASPPAPPGSAPDEVEEILGRLEPRLRLLGNFGVPDFSRAGAKAANFIRSTGAAQAAPEEIIEQVRRALAARGPFKGRG